MKYILISMINKKNDFNGAFIPQVHKFHKTSNFIDKCNVINARFT